MRRIIVPILRVRKNKSWKIGRVLPAVPSHSYGNLSGARLGSPLVEFVSQGAIIPTKPAQLGNHRIDKSKRVLKYSPKVLRFYPRGFTKTAKRRTMQKLNIVPSPHLYRHTKMPKFIREVETIGFSEMPIKPLQRSNALNGRDQNGFLTSNL